MNDRDYKRQAYLLDQFDIELSIPESLDHANAIAISITYNDPRPGMYIEYTGKIYYSKEWTTTEEPRSHDSRTGEISYDRRERLEITLNYHRLDLEGRMVHSYQNPSEIWPEGYLIPFPFDPDLVVRYMEIKIEDLIEGNQLELFNEKSEQ